MFTRMLVLLTAPAILPHVGSPTVREDYLIQVLRETKTNWVAVKELNLSYYIGETLLFTIYTH